MLKWGKQIICKKVRLDQVLDLENRIPRLLKIDVEGSEFLVLKGSEKLLRSPYPPLISIE